MTTDIYPQYGNILCVLVIVQDRIFLYIVFSDD